jgi:hypothetical protein
VPNSRFHTTLGLGAPCGDGADAELREGAAHLGRGPRVGEAQLLGRQLALSLAERPVAVVIHGSRQAVAADDGPQHLEVARGVLLVAERGRDHPARGVVDRGHQGELGPASLEPVVARPVELEQETLLGHPVPSTPVAGRTPVARAGATRGAQDAAHRDPAQRDALVFRQQFREVAVVGPVVAGPSELDHALPDRRIEASGRRPTAIPMDQGRRPMGEIGGLEPPHLARAQGQQGGGLPGGQLTGHQAGQDVGSALVVHGHRDGLPHRRRLTKSRTSWP